MDCLHTTMHEPATLAKEDVIQLFHLLIRVLFADTFASHNSC